MGSVTEPPNGPQVGIKYDIYCNYPFRLTVRSKNGGFKNTNFDSAPKTRFATCFRYETRVDVEDSDLTDADRVETPASALIARRKTFEISTAWPTKNWSFSLEGSSNLAEHLVQ